MTKQKSGRLWKWLFIFSVALNLMFIGLIGGSIWQNAGDTQLKRAQNELLNALPEEKRVAFQDIFKEHYRRSRPHRWQMFWRYRKGIKELQSRDFDREKFEDIVSQISQTHVALTKLRYQLVLDSTRGLTYEERRAFVNIWKRRLRQIRRIQAGNR